MAEKNKGEKEKSVKCPIWVVQDTEKCVVWAGKKSIFNGMKFYWGRPAAEKREKLLTQVQHKQHDKTMVKIGALKVSIQQGQKRENKS